MCEPPIAIAMPAALWPLLPFFVGQPAGLYSMRDVLGLSAG
ncbi:MAG: hypothetical protein WCI09_08670 [Planctomycetota bacterium]